MRIRNILTLTCLLASFSLPACDEATEASELELAAADEAADREADADKLAAAPVDDEEDEANQPDSELLGFSAAPDAVFGGGACQSGQVAYVDSPISSCATCKANLYYPGQWVKHYRYVCQSNGQWSNGTPTGTTCDHC